MRTLGRPRLSDGGDPGPWCSSGRRSPVDLRDRPRECAAMRVATVTAVRVVELATGAIDVGGAQSHPRQSLSPRSSRRPLNVAAMVSKLLMDRVVSARGGLPLGESNSPDPPRPGYLWTRITSEGVGYEAARVWMCDCDLRV